MIENRVLTLAEVLALEEGREVWVEMSRVSYFESRVHKYSPVESRSIRDIHEPRLVDSDGGWFPVHAEWVGGEYRVWSLPQPPTEDELSRNPWEV